MCRSSILVESRPLTKKSVNNFMSEGEQPKFQLNPKIEQTFSRNHRQRQSQNYTNMENQNNNNNPANKKCPRVESCILSPWSGSSHQIICIIEPLRFQFGYRVSGVWRKCKVWDQTYNAQNDQECWTIWETAMPRSLWAY